MALFNRLEDVSCRPAQGAMYTFPRIILPPPAIAAAERAKMQPDEFYCMQLLNETGVVRRRRAAAAAAWLMHAGRRRHAQCVVPGSGFRQREGTFHFRCTFLPPLEDFEPFMQRIEAFHKAFMDRFKRSIA